MMVWNMSWKHNRRSIIDVPPWIGNDNLLSYYHKCPTDLHRNLFATLFETGGRVSEVVELRPEQFNWNDNAIVIGGMVVLKYRRRMRRDVYIKRDEENPLAEDLVSFVEGCGTDYLFPRTAPLTGEVIVPNMPTSRTRLYLKVREISDDLWCHWFRSQRASFLVYVRGLDAFQLKDWFNWKSMDSAGHYVKGKTLAEALGIEKVPGLPTKISKIDTPKTALKTRMTDEEYERMRREVMGG